MSIQWISVKTEVWLIINLHVFESDSFINDEILSTSSEQLHISITVFYDVIDR